jgi:hypothetical protein
MTASKAKTLPANELTPAARMPGKGGRRPPRGPASNKLMAPDARWQRFQRYVWDKKKG